MGPNPRIAAGSTVVSSWLRLFRCTKGKKHDADLKKVCSQLLTLEVISTPGVSRCRKRERSGRCKPSAAGGCSALTPLTQPFDGKELLSFPGFPLLPHRGVVSGDARGTPPGMGAFLGVQLIHTPSPGKTQSFVLAEIPLTGRCISSRPGKSWYFGLQLLNHTHS